MAEPLTHARAHVRRNFALNVVDGAVFAFGLSLASRTTVLPVFVTRLGGDNVAVGLIPVLWVVGFNLPQLAVANWVRHHPRKKPLVLMTGLLQRLPWLLLAGVTFFFIERMATSAGLVVFFALLTLAAVGGSLNMPVWFDLLAKLTPVRRRGRLFALRLILGAALGILGGWIVERVLAALAYPVSFAVLFAAAFVVMMGSYLMLALLHEEGDPPPERTVPYAEFLRGLPGVLRRERNFRRFLVAQVLLVVAMSAEAFYVVDALATFDLPERFAGRFIIVMSVSVIAANLFFGHLADRFGHRINLVLAGAWTVVAALAALWAPVVEVYYLAFVGAALTLGLHNMSKLPFVAELCGERDRSVYVALTNVVTAPFVLAGLLGGWVADAHGFDLVFVAAALAALGSALWMLLMVHEPRNESLTRRP